LEGISLFVVGFETSSFRSSDFQVSWLIVAFGLLKGLFFPCCLQQDDCEACSWSYSQHGCPQRSGKDAQVRNFVPSNDLTKFEFQGQHCDGQGKGKREGRRVGQVDV
jgi:hypothetical protein